MDAAADRRFTPARRVPCAKVRIAPVRKKRGMQRLYPILLAAGALLLGSALGGRAAEPVPVRGAPFPDVPPSHWAYPAVEELRQRGIMRGYPPEAAATVPNARRRAPHAVRPQPVRSPVRRRRKER